MRRLLVIGCVVVTAACINFSARVSDVCATTGSCACVEPGNCCVNPGFSCDDTSACCSGSRCVMGSCVARAAGGGSATAGGNAAAGGTATAGGSGGGAPPGDWVYEAWWIESVPLEPLGDGGYLPQVKRAPFDPEAVHIDESRTQVVFAPDAGNIFCPPTYALICGSFRAKGSRTSAEVALGVIISTADNSPPNLAMVVSADGGLSQQVALSRAQCGTSTGLGGVDLLDGQLAVSCGNAMFLNGSVLSTKTGSSTRHAFDVSCAGRGCVVPWQSDSPVSFLRTTFDVASATTIVDHGVRVIADDKPTPATAVAVLDDGGVFAAWSVFSRDAGASADSGVWVETPGGDGGLVRFPAIPAVIRMTCLDACVVSWSNNYNVELRRFEAGQWVELSAGFEGIGVLSWAGVLRGRTLVVAEPRLSGNSALFANGVLRQTIQNGRQLTIVRHR